MTRRSPWRLRLIEAAAAAVLIAAWVVGVMTLIVLAASVWLPLGALVCAACVAALVYASIA